MKLIQLISCLEYPCTINLNILNEKLKDIPVPFQRSISFPRKYNNMIDILNEMSPYFNNYVVLFEEISTGREYRIDVY